MKSGFEACGIGQFGRFGHFPILNPSNPVRTPTGIADSETAFPRKSGLSGENRWNRDGFASSHKGGALSGSDADTGSAVTSRAAADQNRIEMVRPVGSDDFRQRLEQQGIVTSVAGETFFQNDRAVHSKSQRGGIGGSFKDQDRRHASRLVENAIYGS